MKKLLALFLVLVMGVTVLALAGCGGGDTEQAKTDLREADQEYAALEEELTTLQTTLTTTIGGAMSGNFSVVTPEALQQADQAVTGALEKIPRIKESYARVDELDGVEDYNDYASAMQEVLTAQEKAIRSGKQLIDSLMPVVASGDTAQIQQWFQANNSALMEAQSTASEVDDAYREAQRIKSDNDLEF